MSSQYLIVYKNRLCIRVCGGIMKNENNSTVLVGTNHKIYKDSFTTRLDYNVKYDDENIYAPNFKGKYVLKVVIKSKYGKSDNYFGLNIK